MTNSIAAFFPELAREWHPSRNRLRPEQVSTASHRKIWWQCPKDREHVYDMSPVSRTRSRATGGSGCPFCAGKRLARSNSLAARYPEVAKRWHPTKNGDLRPTDVVSGSGRIVWWKCRRGPDHEWTTTVAAQTSSGCPFCAGVRVAASNSLAKRYPRIAREWHPTRNGDVTPHDIPRGKAMRAWWKCKVADDHEWQAVVSERTRYKTRCPFCVGMRPSSTNSLAIAYPVIAAEWHPTRNGDLRPEGILPKTARLVWWKCDKGDDHEWQATTHYRTVGKGRCPFCIGRRVSVTNSLASLFPDVAREWHPDRNRGTAAEVLGAARDLVWWRCPLGHDWRSAVADRTARKQACPICASGTGLRLPATRRVAPRSAG